MEVVSYHAMRPTNPPLTDGDGTRFPSKYPLERYVPLTENVPAVLMMQWYDTPASPVIFITRTDTGEAAATALACSPGDMCNSNADIVNVRNDVENGAVLRNRIVSLRTIITTKACLKPRAQKCNSNERRKERCRDIQRR